MTMLRVAPAELHRIRPQRLYMMGHTEGFGLNG